MRTQKVVSLIKSFIEKNKNQYRANDSSVNLFSAGFKNDKSANDMDLIDNILRNSPLKTKLIIPNGDIYFKNNLPVLNGGRSIEGIGKPTLNFDSVGNLVSVSGENSSIQNVTIQGKDIVSESAALDITGAYHSFSNIDIKKIKTGIDFAHSNTYILDFDKIKISETDTAINADLFSRNTVNAGERIYFSKSVISNSNHALVGDSNVLDMYFEGCSIDYCSHFFKLGGGSYNFNNCHIENALAAPNRGWQAKQDYLLTTSSGCSVNFTNTHFHLFNLHRLVNPDSTLGNVRFNNSVMYSLGFNGSSKSVHSDEWMYIDIGSTGGSLYTAFINPLSYPNISLASGRDKRQIDRDLSVSLDMAQNKITCVIPAATERGYFKVSF